jgi:hypothetical protein
VVFDKEIDRLATFLPEFVEEHALPEEAQEPLKVPSRFLFVCLALLTLLWRQEALQAAFKVTLFVLLSLLLSRVSSGDPVNCAVCFG